MLNVVTTRKDLPHTPLENQQTYFDSVRLLKGDPPGRDLVNFYTRELAVGLSNANYTRKYQDDYLQDILDGNFLTTKRFNGMGGTPPDAPFYDKKRIQDFMVSMRFKDPMRTVPDVV